MGVTLVPTPHAATGPGAAACAAVARRASYVGEAIFLPQFASYDGSLVVALGTSDIDII